MVLVGRVFANGLGDLCSIVGRVIPKTLKMVLDTSLLTTQQYKVRIKGKVEQSRERIAPSLHISIVSIEKGVFWSLSTMVTNFTLLVLRKKGFVIGDRIRGTMMAWRLSGRDCVRAGNYQYLLKVNHFGFSKRGRKKKAKIESEKKFGVKDN